MLNNRRTYETVSIAGVETCNGCGEDLSETICLGHERRTKIDIVFEKVIEHVDAEIKQCPHCYHPTKGHYLPTCMARNNTATALKRWWSICCYARWWR